MERTTIDFGIDLGTTNSTIAVIDDIDAKIIPNSHGSSITPSAIWIDKRGQLQVGIGAKPRALADPNNGDLEFKLRMGGGLDCKKKFRNNGKEYLPEELSAEVLKQLKMDVQTNMGETVRAAVITVPAAFENSQTAATRKAAQLAGFNLSPLLLEPVAASLAYGFQSESDNVYWMVYDFGGGTFDAAVMRIRDGLIQVVNHDGDNFLGGKLMDWGIVEKILVPALTGQFNLPDFNRGNPKWAEVFGKLKYNAEIAKIEVCRSQAPFELFIDDLCEDADGKPVDFAYSLTPADVQKVSKPYIEKSLSLCRKTLDHEGLKGSDMDRILMVGGTTLNPWVREAVQGELNARLEFGIDPVTIVARGAAIFAGTQVFKGNDAPVLPTGVWRIQIEHKPVGNMPDPDIGGRVISPDGISVEGFTVELVDTRSQWRTGRIQLGGDGVFMTQLFAERQRRHEYEIELCDPTGTRIPTSPDRVSYTLGVIPEDPPVSMTIGVGLADGGVATYVKKGMKISEHGLRKSMDHYTTVLLRAGKEEDVLRIPLIEGEHARARRNHGIGVMTITGADIRRDLPAGSQVEITLIMDQSQQVRVQAYVNVLDADFDISFNPQMNHHSLEMLQKETEQQKERLAANQDKAQKISSLKTMAALTRIEDHQLIEHIDSLIESAVNDPDAVPELDRRLRELSSAIDDIEDAVEWPMLIEKAEEWQRNTEQVMEDHGEAGDRNRFRALKQEMQEAINAGDTDMLQRYINDLISLYLKIVDNMDGWHVGRFDWLAGELQSMKDIGRAEQIIAQGRRALNNNDINALKAANRQLLSLLPDDMQNESRHANVGNTMVR